LLFGKNKICYEIIENIEYPNNIQISDYVIILLTNFFVTSE